jgi:hypothetical protein
MMSMEDVKECQYNLYFITCVMSKISIRSDTQFFLSPDFNYHNTAQHSRLSRSPRKVTTEKEDKRKRERREINRVYSVHYGCPHMCNATRVAHALRSPPAPFLLTPLHQYQPNITYLNSQNNYADMHVIQQNSSTIKYAFLWCYCAI